MKIANALLLIAVVFGPVSLAILGYAAAGGLFLIALIVVLLALNVSVDRFEELALGPVRAKLREKIQEADELSEQLKSAIRLMLSLSVTAGMRAGRFAHEDGKLHKQIFDQARDIARNAKLESTDIDSVLADFFKYVEVDMRSIIVGNRIFDDKESEKLRASIQDWDTPVADRIRQMRQLAEREHVDWVEFEEWMQDYKELTAHKQLRRPDIWWCHHERRHDDFVIKRKSERR